MPAQVETGKSNIAQPAHSLVFEGYHRDATQSIGLSFEPNFFTTWLYKDKLGTNLIGEERYPVHDLDWASTIQALPAQQAVFGLTHGERFTLVPTSIFDEEHAGALLQLNTSFDGTGTLNFDHLHALGITVLYQDETEAQKIADDHFTGLKIQHVVSHLIQTLHKAANKGKVHMFIYNCATHYYFVAFKNAKLALANALNALSDEDVMYYLLYTLKQIGAKTDSEVTFLGNANELVALKSALAPYQPKVNIGISPSHIGLNQSIANEDLSKYFMAYTGQLCA